MATVYRAKLHRPNACLAFLLASNISNFPLYIVALALAVAGGGLSWHVVGNLLAYNIWLDPADIVIPWSWSLSVELEFYAVVPFLILLFRGTLGALLTTIGFVAATIGWCIFALVQYPQLGQHSLIEFLIAERNDDLMLYFRKYYVAMPVRISQFVLGSVVAWAVVYRGEVLTSMPQKLRVLLVMIALSGAIAPLLYNPYGQIDQVHQPALIFDLIFGRVVFGLSIAVLILLLQSGQLPALKRVLAAKILVPIARFSFSMYLFHPLFAFLGIYLFLGENGVTSVSPIQYIGVFLITVCGAMALGFVTWRFIERPAIRYGRRWFG